ncbi:MAG: hypothetical protein HKO59_04875 [Phycisphaerales bacterium]|nr:hypothetical protein [Phycisphaerae bacterium]NNF43710.1 hypothetical protein [Phycisphaerales bacterium]NNM25309.1 hypothetical protein [Phycisphaerales bacterium]
MKQHALGHHHAAPGRGTAWGLVAGAGLLLAAADMAAADPPRLAVGEPFPDLVLPLLDGEPCSVADYRGQKLILHVFASW